MDEWNWIRFWRKTRKYFWILEALIANTRLTTLNWFIHLFLLNFKLSCKQKNCLVITYWHYTPYFLSIYVFNRLQYNFISRHIKISTKGWHYNVIDSMTMTMSNRDKECKYMLYKYNEMLWEFVARCKEGKIEKKKK